MERFEALVRLIDLADDDPAKVRRHLDERLRAGGFTRWEIIAVAPERSDRIRRHVRRRLQPQPPVALSGVLLAATVILWSLWLLWLIAG